MEHWNIMEQNKQSLGMGGLAFLMFGCGGVRQLLLVLQRAARVRSGFLVVWFPPVQLSGGLAQE